MHETSLQSKDGVTDLEQVFEQMLYDIKVLFIQYHFDIWFLHEFIFIYIICTVG